MADKCAAMHRHCRQCGRDNKKEKLAVCPGCGADMHCQRYASFGSDFCPQHGGPSPARGFYGLGIAIVTGEGSKFAIAKLASKYLELTKDGRFLSNRHSMEIIRTRVQQLAERIDMNEAPDRLRRLSELWADFLIQDANGDQLEARKTKIMISAEFEAAYHDYAAWTQMFDALDLDRKMVESEVKIAKDLKAILTAEDAYELAAKLLASIIEAAQSIILEDNVRSKFLKRIQYEFAKLVGDRGSREDDEGLGGSSREIIDSVSSSLD